MFGWEIPISISHYTLDYVHVLYFDYVNTYTLFENIFDFVVVGDIQLVLANVL